MVREIVTIDEERCDGCGRCVPACAEGALRIVDGKARLIAERLCDGLGACLGHCPRGAIRIERRRVAAFEHPTACEHRPTFERPEAFHRPTGPALPQVAPAPAARQAAGGGCPGSRLAQLDRGPVAPGVRPGATATGPGQPSALAHWPVQLRLLPPDAPVLRGARLLLAADCVPVACADFHAALLRDHAVAIACPKLDEPRGNVARLAALLAGGRPAAVTVARMEVPCCAGLLHAALEARELAGVDVPIDEVIVGIRGQILARGPAAGAAGR